jgi:pimeloyl-ACP methyl ester carboxylesterase
LATPIVFVHGFACTHADWRLQVAQIELVTGVGHFPQLEAPEQVNELLSGLIGM